MTFTIDDAWLRPLRQKALDSGKPFQQVVNETLRAGLNQPAIRECGNHRCPSLSMAQPRRPVFVDMALPLAAEPKDGKLVINIR
ncbi:MAG: hypothetical protein ACKOCI_00020, partial [Cyanobium sp.]